MKHTKKLLMILVIVFLLIGLGTLVATDNTQNNTNIKKNTDKNPNNIVNDNTKTQTTEKQNQILEKQIQKTQKLNKKQEDSTPIDINNYNDLTQALSDGTTSTKTLNIATNVTLEGNLTLNRSITALTINGNYNTIDGNGQYQFLDIYLGQTVIINNITITNCYAKYGGAIFNWGNLTIINSCDKQFSSPL